MIVRRLILTVALIIAAAGATPAEAASIEDGIPGPTAESHDAESHDAESHDPTFWNIFTNLPADLLDWGKITFSSENVPQLAGVLGMTAAMMPSDYETWMATSRAAGQNPNLKSLFIHGESWSSGLFQVTMSVGFLAWGIAGNKRALRTAFEVGESVLNSGIIVQILKRASGRQSPSVSTQRGGAWTGYPGESAYDAHLNHYDAMPSGHLSSAYVIYETIALNYPEQKWIPWVGYPLMGIFAVSCVGDNIHWYSDFPIAFALGYSFAKITAYRYHPELRVAANRSAMKYVPNFSLGYHEMSDRPLLVAHWDF